MSGQRTILWFSDSYCKVYCKKKNKILPRVYVNDEDSLLLFDFLIPRLFPCGFFFLWGYIQNMMYVIKLDSLGILKEMIIPTITATTTGAPDMLRMKWIEVRVHIYGPPFA